MHSPRARLWAWPARVRSETRSRSNSASTANSRKIIRPAAELVSICSVRLTRSAPALRSRSPMLIASLVDRASRESE